MREELNRAIASHLESQTGRMRKLAGYLQFGRTASSHYLHAATSPLDCQGGREPWTRPAAFCDFILHRRRATCRFPSMPKWRTESAQVVVAIRPIARGAVITAADVEMQIARNWHRPLVAARQSIP